MRDEGIRRLIRVLAADQRVEVRVRAARTLGLLGHPAAVGPLVAAAGWGQPSALRAVATTALGELGSAKAVPTLVLLLGDPTLVVADAAALALLALGPVSRTALEELGRAGRADRRAAYAVAALNVTRLADYSAPNI
ncbi:HEAT repeat domain-containing protein [Cryptosporangium arvum]|uniref:HEAT repeat domain-containing protein n=1 Tax=Cryptosporangium arvum TaxID=80871 RepID=UPI0004B80623|nr:HEAT repeat domain-containing protein [Cryptosporangium arvum]